MNWWTAGIIEVSKSTSFQILKKGKSIKRVSSTINPVLSEKNKKDQIKFCLSWVLPGEKFLNFKKYVHKNEKWFKLTKYKWYYVVLYEKTFIKHVEVRYLYLGLYLW